MQDMYFGYSDESGEPGVGKNSHDFFCVCIVLVNGRDEAEKLSLCIAKLRDGFGLPPDYEFHYAKNSKKVRAAFIDLMAKLDFKFLSVSIKKNNLRSFASMANMAELILRILERNNINLGLEMDKNPLLYKELRVQKKKFGIILHCSQKESRGHDLIQLADYVTSVRTRALKHPGKDDAKNAFSGIKRKMLDSVEI